MQKQVIWSRHFAGDVAWELITYPDGQISVKVPPLTDESQPARVWHRVATYTDLVELVALGDAMRGAGYDPMYVRLCISCLLGQRSDRRFADGQSHDLRVVASILRLSGFGYVSVLDPHSDATSKLIWCYESDLSPYQYILWAISDVKEREGRIPAVLFPDQGAASRYAGIAMNAKVASVSSAKKTRNPNGTISIELPSDLPTQSPVLVIDDFCDAGGTFLSLATATRGSIGNMYLYVTHGLFSKGIAPLVSVGYKHVYTTDSLPQLTPHRFLTVFPTGPLA